MPKPQLLKAAIYEPANPPSCACGCWQSETPGIMLKPLDKLSIALPPFP